MKKAETRKAVPLKKPKRNETVPEHRKSGSWSSLNRADRNTKTLSVKPSSLKKSPKIHLTITTPKTKRYSTGKSQFIETIMLISHP